MLHYLLACKFAHRSIHQRHLTINVGVHENAALPAGMQMCPSISVPVSGVDNSVDDNVVGGRDGRAGK